jgi:hypothetical protein
MLAQSIDLKGVLIFHVIVTVVGISSRTCLGLPESKATLLTHAS